MSAPIESNNTPPDELRQILVEKLLSNGVLRDAAVERALRTVPRHLFLPAIPVEDAYSDNAIPTHEEDGVPVSSASQPAIVAIMLQQLGIEPGMRVLEIGAGTGYNAALLAELIGPTGHVTTVDIDEEIAAEARAHLDAAGYSRVRVIAADGAAGWLENAPYDRIELTVGATDITPAWYEQLVEGGLMTLPIWLGISDASVALRKHDGALTSESLAPCGFMRLRGSEKSDMQWIALGNGLSVGSEDAQRLAEPIKELLAGASPATAASQCRSHADALAGITWAAAGGDWPRRATPLIWAATCPLRRLCRGRGWAIAQCVCRAHPDTCSRSAARRRSGRWWRRRRAGRRRAASQLSSGASPRGPTTPV